MPRSAIDKKAWRDLWRLKGQIASIALVVASGIASFIALRGTYLSLESSRAAYYDRCRFADVFANAERVPEPVARQLEALPQVAALETRIAEDATVPIAGLPRPAYGRLLSLPAHREPATNALHLRSGHLPERGSSDQAVLLESFAEAHGLAVGDTVPAVINGKLRQLRIVGIALSPEFVFAVRPGALADDPRRYAVLWMDRSTLAAAFQLEGAFNDVSLRLQPGVSEAASLAAVDRILEPYGTDGAFTRKDQLSHRILSQELGQLEGLAGMVPLVFIGVAAFLLNLVLARLIRLQRAELATLKALGYPNRIIARHYASLVAAVVVPGSLLGIGLGIVLGQVMLGLYRTSFRFPTLEFATSPSVVMSAVLASAAAAGAGAWGSVRAAVKLPPAQAMQPPAPAVYRRGLLERLRIGRFVGPQALMVLREVQRRPLRTLFSSLGIAGATALLVLGRFGWDSILSYFQNTFERAQRQDLEAVFRRPLPRRVVRELAVVPGVLRAEGVRSVPIRVHHDHRVRNSVLLGFPENTTLRQLIARGGRVEKFPEGGVLVTRTLAEILELRIGDRPRIDLREGERRTVRPLIVGFVDESIGLSVYAPVELVASLSGDAGAVSSVLLQVEEGEREHVERHLRRSPEVLEIVDVRGDMDRMFDTMANIFDVWTAISIALAASVVFGVVYNNARIALSARGRDLASLRVLGFTRREVSAILLQSLAVEVFVALPVGLVLGRLWAHQFMSTINQEDFRWEVVISARTQVLVILVVLVASLASALWVRRGVDQLDLIEVLKARE